MMARFVDSCRDPHRASKVFKLSEHPMVRQVLMPVPGVGCGYHTLQNFVQSILYSMDPESQFQKVEEAGKYTR
eukprot:5096722-Prorocentrum_lima.AAC.1